MGMAIGSPQSLPEPCLQGRIPAPDGVLHQGPDLHPLPAQPSQAGEGQGIPAVIARPRQNVNGDPRWNQVQGAQGRMLLKHDRGNPPVLDGPVFQVSHLVGIQQRDHGLVLVQAG